jgi:putative membrane protein
MPASAADQSRRQVAQRQVAQRQGEQRLVDMEFRPGDLPAADASSRPGADQARGEGTDLLAGGKRTSLAAWLALGASAVILLLVVGNAAVTFARNAVQQGSVVDMALLLALIVLAGAILTLLARQTRALRKLKSAERAREMAGQLARLDSAGSGTRLRAVLQALYSDNAIVLGRLRAAASALQPHHADRDVIELLNRDVFAPMDRAADERIQRAAVRAAVGVSTCPHPSLDALVVIAVSVALVRDLMSIYGLRHSARSLLRVLTHSLLTASSAAVMSTVVDLAMQAAHDRIAAAVAGTAGEALVVARRMFALGALAKAEIRPLPVG